MHVKRIWQRLWEQWNIRTKQAVERILLEHPSDKRRILQQKQLMNNSPINGFPLTTTRLISWLVPNYTRPTIHSNLCTRNYERKANKKYEIIKPSKRVMYKHFTETCFVHHRVCKTSNTMGATSRAGTAYPSEAHERTPAFSGVSVPR
jgi:hypothetical protein